MPWPRGGFSILNKYVGLHSVYLADPLSHRERTGKQKLIGFYCNWRLQYLRERGVWNEKDALGLANRIEYTSLIWKTRLNQPVSIFDRIRKDKAKIQCAQKRAENAVRTIKEKFPKMAHTKVEEVYTRTKTQRWMNPRKVQIWPRRCGLFFSLRWMTGKDRRQLGRWEVCFGSLL